MKKLKIIGLSLVVSMFFTQCFPDNLKAEMEKVNSTAMVQIADMEFKHTIALIELHKMRFGKYPLSLDSIKFSSITDNLSNSSFDYKLNGAGYDLNSKNSSLKFINSFNYPNEFWNGLGLVKSNLKKQ
jgi:hypothetical protein